MKQFLNSTLQFAFVAIGLLTATISALITANYLYKMGGDSYFSLFLVAVGVLLDAAKALFPVGCLILWRNEKRGLAVAGFTLTLFMIITSVNFAYINIGDSIRESNLKHQASSEEYKNHQETIELAKANHARLVAKQMAWTEVKRLTKADSLDDEIEKSINKINRLTNKPIPKPEQSKLALSKATIIIFSVLIELVATASFVIAVSLTIKQANTENYHEEPMFMVARNALLSGIKPSERVLQDHLEIPRTEAARILTLFENEGFVIRIGNRRYLASDV